MRILPVTPTLMPITIVIAICFLILPVAEADVFLWPMPQFVAWETGPALELSSSFTINSPKQLELREAAKRYTKLIFKERWLPVQSPIIQLNTIPDVKASSKLHSLEIIVGDLQADLQHGVDESYNISIPDAGGKASLRAATVWGALHGLETFSQLVRRQSEKSSILIIEHAVYIRDGPIFPHRGLVLDTSRNYYPVKDILRTIRALGCNKLNVFHWHITDSHSFPLELSKEPELASKGAYGVRERYTHGDVKRIIKYARARGVRVIPELDMPGHTGSWSGAYPDIVTCHDQFWMQPNLPWSSRMASEPGWPGQLNPLHPHTYQVVKNVVDEVTSMFPDKFYHGGGDEVNPGCWNNSKDIEAYTLAGGSMTSMLSTFVNTTHPYITSNGKTAVYWQDLLLDDVINVSSSVLPRETTILQTWLNGPHSTKLTTSAGYRTIVSSSDNYYLDCGHADFMGNDSRYDQNSNDDPNNPVNYDGGDGGSWCGPFKSWARFYDYDITYNLTTSEAALVLGGEAALWSEQSDATVVDSRLWPRTSAMAETLWSGNKASDGTKRYAEALNRLNDWRYRLVERGIRAEPLQPLWCLKHPGQCNVNT